MAELFDDGRTVSLCWQKGRPSGRNKIADMGAEMADVLTHGEHVLFCLGAHQTCSHMVSTCCFA